jgi:hypothetical protein
MALIKFLFRVLHLWPPSSTLPSEACARVRGTIRTLQPGFVSWLLADKRALGRRRALVVLWRIDGYWLDGRNPVFAARRRLSQAKRLRPPQVATEAICLVAGSPAP